MPLASAAKVKVNHSAKGFVYKIGFGRSVQSKRSLHGMAIRVVKFLNRGTKLERLLPKIQHPQRKLLKIENWVNGELSKNAKI